MLLADRSSAEAFASMPYALEGCPLRVDACRAPELLLSSCVAAPHVGPLHKERCEHGWAPTLLRHGVPTTTCGGVSGMLGSPV